MKKILIIDTLATGLNTERCAIYKIGGIFCEDNPGMIKEKTRFSLAVRPFEGARIIENSLWVGGVGRRNLVGYPPQEEAFADFIKLIENHINVRNANDKLYICGFNVAAFDSILIKNWFYRNDDPRFRDCFFVQTLDLMSIAAFALIGERDNMPDFHLETVARYLGVTPTKNENYNCLDNAETCLKMYRELKARLGTGERGEWEPLERVYSNMPINK